MQTAARNAGKVINGSFNKAFNQSFKKDSAMLESLVTEIDIDSQNIIKDTIVSELKAKGIAEDKIGFIGEENLNVDGEHIFIIDPIDGTTNFAYGIPYFGVSIGYRYKDKIVAGTIFNPIDNAMYVAEIGKGAFKIIGNEKIPLKMNKYDLKKSILAGHYNSKSLDNQFNAYQKIVKNIAGIRTMGSIAIDLCLLAENKMQMLINGGSYIWDLAAGKLIIEESGGLITDWQGKELEFDYTNPEKQFQVIVCLKDNLPTLIDVLNN